MPFQNNNSADASVLERVQRAGGSVTIDYRTDDVQRGYVRLLDKLTAAGKLKKVVSLGGLVHTFALVA